MPPDERTRLQARVPETLASSVARCAFCGEASGGAGMCGFCGALRALQPPAESVAGETAMASPRVEIVQAAPSRLPLPKGRVGKSSRSRPRQKLLGAERAIALGLVAVGVVAAAFQSGNFGGVVVGLGASLLGLVVWAAASDAPRE